MLGNNVYKITVNPKINPETNKEEYNWESANNLTQELVNNGYAVMITLEENLIIINYVDATLVFILPPSIEEEGEN